jgi:uncharacterized membrane protein
MMNIPWTKSEKTAAGAFVAWSLAGLIFTPLKIEPADVWNWSLPTLLADFIWWCLRWGDAIMMVLATINTHLVTTHFWGKSGARKWLIITILVGAIVETIGVKTGWLFGNYVYTDAFGGKIGGILPFTIPLAWFVIVTNALVLIRQFWPQWNRWGTATATGLTATAIDWVMEPFAVTVKQYWIWEGDVIPWSNYITWFGVSFSLVLCFLPEDRKVTTRMEWRPALVLGSTLLIFLAGRIVHGV